MITHKDTIETITRLRLGLRELAKLGDQYQTLSENILENIDILDQFIEIGMKDHQDLKQALAIERAMNRELQKQIEQLTCHKNSFGV